MSKNHNKLKNQSHKPESLLKGQSLNNDCLSKYEKNFRFSFEFLDRNQGQSLKEWVQKGYLLKMNETLMEYCKEPIRKKLGDKFKEYGEFPKKSGFVPPSYIEDDVNWSALHITGKVVLGGFIYNNTFFVVFLDGEHQFWKCEKKHT